MILSCALHITPKLILCCLKFPPAEKYIDLSHVVVMKFEDDKITVNTSMESGITFSTNMAC